MTQTILLVFHILVAFALITIILLQQGKGAAAGAAFGSGASATVFGARGSASFLTRTTTVLAIIFFANSFFLSYLASQKAETGSLMERVSVPVPAGAEPAGPTTPVESAAPDVPAPVEQSSTSDLPTVAE